MGNRGDIAILKLEDPPIQISSLVRPVCLPPAADSRQFTKDYLTEGYNGTVRHTYSIHQSTEIIVFIICIYIEQGKRSQYLCYIDTMCSLVFLGYGTCYR